MSFEKESSNIRDSPTPFQIVELGTIPADKDDMMNDMIRGVCGLMLVSALTACPSGVAEFDSLDSPDDLGNGSPETSCAIDDDCALAAASCCECPSFALSQLGDDPDEDACLDVGCQPPSACPAIEAACEHDVCIVRCTPLPCDLSCAGGFAIDATGCLTCACAIDADTSETECSRDDECVQVTADCCGCSRGGSDTAVPAAQADAYTEALECSDTPACPELDTCDTDATPRCIAETCVLTGSPETVPPDSNESILCGTPAFPVCETGMVCILNDPQANDATLVGVGICRGV